MNNKRQGTVKANLSAVLFFFGKFIQIILQVANTLVRTCRISVFPPSFLAASLHAHPQRVLLMYGDSKAKEMARSLEKHILVNKH